MIGRLLEAAQPNGKRMPAVKNAVDMLHQSCFPNRLRHGKYDCDMRPNEEDRRVVLSPDSVKRVYASVRIVQQRQVHRRSILLASNTPDEQRGQAYGRSTMDSLHVYAFSRELHGHTKRKATAAPSRS